MNITTTTPGRRLDESSGAYRIQQLRQEEEEIIQHRLLIEELEEQQKLLDRTYSSDNHKHPPPFLQVYTRGTIGAVRSIGETISTTTPNTRKLQQHQIQLDSASSSIASSSIGNISSPPPTPPPLSGRSRSTRSLSSTTSGSQGSRSMSQPQRSSRRPTKKNSSISTKALLDEDDPMINGRSNRHYRSRSQEAMMTLFENSNTENSDDKPRGRAQNQKQQDFRSNRGYSRDREAEHEDNASIGTNGLSNATNSKNIFRRSRSQGIVPDDTSRSRNSIRDTIDGNAKRSATKSSPRSTARYSNRPTLGTNSTSTSSGNNVSNNEMMSSSVDQTTNMSLSPYSPSLSSITPNFPIEYRDVTPSMYKEKIESNTSTTNRSTRSTGTSVRNGSTTGSQSNNNNSNNSTSKNQYNSNNNSSSNSSSNSRDPTSSSAASAASSTVSHQTRELLKAHSKVARRIVDELNRTQGFEKNRIPAVTNACAVFDHSDEARHDIELYYGSALALAKFLAVATNDDEIRMILSALEMVFRGTPKQCADSFSKISHSLLNNLLKQLERFETRNVKHADVSILNITKILYYLSRSTELRSMLCRPKAMLQSMARLSTRNLNNECRTLWVRIVANLANIDDNKVLMYEQDGLVDSLLRVGHFDGSGLVRQLAMTSLMEFSTAPTNHTSMAKNEVLVSTIVKVVLVEKNATTRECAISTLQNLAFAKENRVKLVSLKNGIVLEALKKALANDPDMKARRHAAGALTNLACEETAQVMGMNKGLLQTLAIVSTKDEKDDVQTRASLALTKIASSINVTMPCHETMLDALVVASLSKATNSVAAVLRVKARSPENREALARHSGVVDTLCDICVSDIAQATDRDSAIRAIMHLVNEDKNRKILCNKTVLHALVVAANYTDPLLLEARDSAVRGLQRLATEPSNRNYMAHHPGLIVAISKSVEREAILQREGQESEYGFLAKPLLLSLLVAM